MTSDYEQEWRAKADRLSKNDRVRAALRRELSEDELSPDELEEYEDLVVYMEPSPEAVAFFDRLKGQGRSVGVDPDQVPTLEDTIAEAVHKAIVSKWGSTQGHCKNASAAVALALGDLEEPVAICNGVVIVDGAEHEHCWCRIGHLIIDATADQFGSRRGPLVGSETALPHYRETSFFLFQPSEALELFRQANRLLDEEARADGAAP